MERAAAARAGAGTGASAGTGEAVPLQLLKDIVDVLPKASFHGPGTHSAWMRVIMAIHTVSSLNGYPDEGLALAHSFSLKSPEAYDWKRVEKLWLVADGSVGMGSLVWWLKDAGLDAPFKERLRTSCTSDDTVDRASLIAGDIMATLVEEWPSHFSGGRLAADTFHVSPAEDVLCFFDSSSGVQGRIYPDYSVEVQGFGIIGVLSKGMRLTELSRMHNDIKPATAFDYTRNTGMATLKGPDESITIFDPYTDKTHMHLNVNGRNSTVTKATTGWLMDTIADQAKLYAPAGAGNWFNIIINNNTTVNNYQRAPPTSKNDFVVIRDKLLDFAAERRLRKKDGIVYEPVTGCPCAYVELCTYAVYIQEVLRGNEVYRSNPKRFDEALKFLQNYNEEELPELDGDRGLLSFSNGVLRLDPSMEFVPYPGEATAASWPGDGHAWLVGKTARNHLPVPYTGCTDTPLLDDVVASQMPPEAVNVLYALMGRTLFPIGTYDHWDIMPYFLGLAGTGKSTVVKVLLKMFADHAIGSISETNEQVFGLESKYTKEILEAQDVPAKMSRHLNQQMFQKMVCGERLSVAKKGASASDIVWTAPMVMCGNTFLDYEDAGGCISRRVVVFEFKRFVAAPDAGLLARIIKTEMPNVVAKFLTAYFGMVAENADKVFWSFCPDYLKTTRETVRQETSYVARFLAASIDDYADTAHKAVAVTRADNAITYQKAFREAFGHFMRDNYPHESAKISPNDNSALLHAGYVVEASASVCHACKQLARGRPDKCCNGYDGTKRGKAAVIHRMRIVERINDATSMF